MHFGGESASSQIAQRLNRRPSTISREIRLQVSRKRWCYSAIKGQELSDIKKKKGRKKKILENEELQKYVHTKLRIEWSPEEIAKRLKLDYPPDSTMRVSHESIYTFIYCLPRGSLRKEFISSLRQERSLRKNRKHPHERRGAIKGAISIHEAARNR